MKNITACRPPKGKTYLTIGQDLFSIQEYITEQYNASLHSQNLSPLSSYTPAGVMVYTSLFSFLNGTKLATDYGSGIEYADGLLDSLFYKQDVGLQIGLWLDGAQGCQTIVDGLADEDIQNMIDYFKHSSASQIFLRVGYEFDNPDFGYSTNPTLYKEAFRYLVTKCRTHLTPLELSHVQFVWHSWAGANTKYISINSFYPGDNYVDWIGVSIFTQVYEWAPSNSFGGDLTDVEFVLKFAKLHSKPTMIAESTPFGGINQVLRDKNISYKNVWSVWFQNVIDLINNHDISMWSYINCNWEDQPMWHEVGFGDSRISSNQIVMKQWKMQVLSENSRFLMSGSMSSCNDHSLMAHDYKEDVLSQTMAIYSTSILEHQSYDQIKSTIGGFFVLVLFTIFIFIRTKRSSFDHYSRNRFYDSFFNVDAVRRDSESIPLNTVIDIS